MPTVDKKRHRKQHGDEKLYAKRVRDRLLVLRTRSTIKAPSCVLRLQISARLQCFQHLLAIKERWQKREARPSRSDRDALEWRAHRSTRQRSRRDQ